MAITTQPLGFNCGDCDHYGLNANLGTGGSRPGDDGGPSVKCINEYNEDCVQRLPEDGAILAPWLQLQLSHGGITITVGNESTPDDDESANNAVIVSFEFGHSNGFYASMVVHDQKGTQFGRFMENLLKDAKCMEISPAEIEATLEFGWIKKGCQAPIGLKRSPCYYLFPESIEATFSNGKFMYEVTLRDIMFKAAEMVCDKVIGSDDAPVALRDAIIELMTNECAPNVSSVKFMKSGPDGPVACPFETGEQTDEEGRLAAWGGPKDKWECSGKDKLQIVHKWLQDWPAEEGRSFVGIYNACVEGGEVIFWADPKPKDDGTIQELEGNCLGYYIINGGKTSPVISFDPKMKWMFANIGISGGNVSSTNVESTEEGNKKQGRRESSTLTRAAIPCAGQLATINTSETLENIEGKNATAAADRAQTAAQKALTFHGETIEAELTIIGDPSMVPPAVAPLGRNVGIVFINPYHILEDKASDRCGVWAISTPPCNVHLSCRYWTLLGVTHSIELGRYTTTLKLTLPAPGVDFDSGKTLAGEGSKCWAPPFDCPSAA